MHAIALSNVEMNNLSLARSATAPGLLVDLGARLNDATADKVVFTSDETSLLALYLRIAAFARALACNRRPALMTSASLSSSGSVLVKMLSLSAAASSCDWCSFCKGCISILTRFFVLTFIKVWEGGLTVKYGRCYDGLHKVCVIKK